MVIELTLIIRYYMYLSSQYQARFIIKGNLSLMNQLIIQKQSSMPYFEDKSSNKWVYLWTHHGNILIYESILNVVKII